MIAVLVVASAFVIGAGYALLAVRLAERPRIWHLPLLAAYAFASLTVLLPDTGFIVAGIAALIGLAIGARRVSRRWALLVAAGVLLSPLLVFRFTTLPIPNVFAFL